MGLMERLKGVFIFIYLLMLWVKLNIGLFCEYYMKCILGICYYFEYWELEIWFEDVWCMVEVGLIWVWIGEFVWF